jgi:ABC-type multidrug transport system fused ATPase/permease subunit
MVRRAVKRLQFLGVSARYPSHVIFACVVVILCPIRSSIVVIGVFPPLVSLLDGFETPFRAFQKFALNFAMSYAQFDVDNKGAPVPDEGVIGGAQPQAGFTWTLLNCLLGLVDRVILCTSRSRPYVKESTSPFLRASLCSRFYFAWASPLIAYTARATKPVTLSELWELRPSETAEDAVADLNKAWADEQTTAAGAGRKPKFSRAVFRTVRYAMMKVALYKLGWIICSLVSNSFLLSQVMQYFSSDKPVSYGVMLVFAFLCTDTLRSVLGNQHWLLASLASMRLRSATRQMMYSKALHIPQTRVTVGAAVNMLMGDTHRLLDAVLHGEFIISTPITVLATLIIMWFQVGPSALAGFLLLLVFIPIQIKIGHLVGALRRRTVKITDERSKTMAEVLNGIKLLKLYAWEAAFADKVANIRRREIAALRSAAFIRAFNTVLVFSVPVLVTLATFATYTLWTGRTLDPTTAFVCVALFNVARFPLTSLPRSTKHISEGLVACQRMQSLLEQPDIDPADQPVQRNGQGEAQRWKENTGEDLPEPNVVIAAHAATYSWRSDQPFASGLGSTSAAPVLKIDTCGIEGMSFEIRVGQCVGVVGSVGSGKSSLLASLLGQLSRRSGGLLLNGDVAYASQSPWVFSGTVRENILFGSTYDEARYQEVVRVCSLETDFTMFPSGDDSEIGERGINLSGGQKSRIGLARAIYSDRPINLLDDPLSAVDVHVGKHLWKECIQGYLLSRGKTVVIVTHQLQYMKDCTQIFHLEKGQMAHQGTFQELVASGFDFTVAGVSTNNEEDDVEESLPTPVFAANNVDVVDTTPLSPPAPLSSPPSSPPPSAPLDPSHIVVAAKPQRSSRTSAPPSSSSTGLEAPSDKPATGPGARKPGHGKLVADEEKYIGAVSGKTLKTYFAAAGSAWLGIGLLTTLLLCKGARLVTDWWLSYWTTNAVGASETVQRTYLAIYAAAALGVMVCALIQSVSFATVTLNASRVFHDRVFSSMMRAQSSWLDTQPTGRILSRFTGDMDVIDSTMPPNIEQASEYQVQVILSIVAIIAVFPWFLLPLCPIAATFVYISQFFRRAARDLKRIDNMSRSPLVSHIQATMQGLENIRAYGRLEEFDSQNRQHVDNATRAYWAFYAANRWVAMRLDVQTTLIASFTVALCIAAHAAGGLTPALAGLAIVQALQTTGIFQASVRLLIDTESQFTCVERLDYYTYKIPHESVTMKPAITDDEATRVMAASSSSIRSSSPRLHHRRQRLGVPAAVVHTLNYWIPAHPAAFQLGTRRLGIKYWYPHHGHPVVVSCLTRCGCGIVRNCRWY